MRNFNTVTAGIAVSELMGPNPYRYALLMSPVANQLAAATIVAQVFMAGINQTWTVPNGVVRLNDIYVWGSGGNSGASGAVLGGGGGGGGGFARTGGLTVVPGTTFAINVDSAGNGSQSTVADATATTIATATSGITPVLNAAGVQGFGTVGIEITQGGAGDASTGLAGTGAGGGGAGGRTTNGTAGAGAVGGAGGGIAGLGGYGVGGGGGNGSVLTVAGVAGTGPGGGGGGGGKTGGAVGAGADGLVVVLYTPADPLMAISIDQDPNLILLQGALNWLPGRAYPVLLTAKDIGDAIMDPWYVISGVAAQKVRVTEYSYVP